MISFGVQTRSLPTGLPTNCQDTLSLAACIRSLQTDLATKLANVHVHFAQFVVQLVARGRVSTIVDDLVHLYLPPHEKSARRGLSV
jgi:hypothetical protein